MLAVSFAIAGPLHLFAPARAKAHVNTGPVQVGISFSPRRTDALGLDYQVAFKRLEALHFRVIRLSAYWSEIDANGYDRLDWLMTEARQSHQPVVLTVGMKGLGWPEFYVPDALVPEGGFHNGQDLGIEPALDAAAVVFVRDTVEHYRLNTTLVAWQVENEPFNRSGPNRLWVDGSFLKQEIAALKSLDRHRPVIVNAFTHFNLVVDQASDRNGFNVAGLLGFDTDGAERDSLSALGKGDILGLDVYTAIGYQLLGQNHVSRADADWPDRLEQLRGLAEKQGKQAWIMEAQAEPWEASYDTLASPLSITPRDIRTNFATLKDAGYSTVLLWGSEYWLWRADHGDSRWMDSVKLILGQEATSPAIALPA
jgi:hypothetical protein